MRKPCRKAENSENLHQYLTFSLSVFIMYGKYYKYREENEGKVYHASDCRHCQKA